VHRLKPYVVSCRVNECRFECPNVPGSTCWTKRLLSCATMKTVPVSSHIKQSAKLAGWASRSYSFSMKGWSCALDDSDELVWASQLRRPIDGTVSGSEPKGKLEGAWWHSEIQRDVSTAEHVPNRVGEGTDNGGG
jgi:hypothetical protein